MAKSPTNFSLWIRDNYEMCLKEVLWQAGYDYDEKQKATQREMNIQMKKPNGQLAQNSKGLPFYLAHEKTLSNGNKIYRWNTLGMAAVLYNYENYCYKKMDISD